MPQKIRVRFAPSPTGPLHIGGVRTALYNYLFAKKSNGTFILRIEDTDQSRYVPGAEDYIHQSLEWLGLTVEEGPEIGGEYGPYRQSERKDIYKKYVDQLVEAGKAYYAFDTPEELTAARESGDSQHHFKYDASTRMEMRNSLTLSEDDVQDLLKKKTPYTVRLLVEPNQKVSFSDEIREEVEFDSTELDDKVLLKADGLPTYHLANVVDDHLMEISHVIRGEEWLSSTAHHVLLYRAFGWEDTMPAFAHLPLILKPSGKGKLSKRDGKKLDVPVFLLHWQGESEEETFKGFDDYGFYPPAVFNFLALLGWSPGDNQEILSREECIKLFDLHHVVKSGSKFDYDKARWFNQQYMIDSPVTEQWSYLKNSFDQTDYDSLSDEKLKEAFDLMKERAMTYADIWEEGKFLFSDDYDFDQKDWDKRYKPLLRDTFLLLFDRIENMSSFTADAIKNTVIEFMSENDLSFGQTLPILRLATTGTTKGPDIFSTMSYLGLEKTTRRLDDCVKEHFTR